MSGYIEQLITVLYGVWRKRWYGLVAMWLVCVVGWIAVALIPDRFESSARIYVDTNSVLGEVMGKAAMSSNALRQVVAMRRTLISRPNLEKVIRRVDLDLTAETDGDMEKLINDLSKNISLRSEGADLFWIAYSSGNSDFSDSENAALAKRVVQNLIAIFFEGDIVEGRDEMANVQRFLEEQIADYERQLEKAERRRADFKRKNLGMLPGEGNFSGQAQRAKGELVKTEDQLNELNLRRQELQRQLRTVPPTMTSTGNRGGMIIGSPLAQQLLQLQGQLDANYARGFTDEHPDVKVLLDRIAKVQADLAGGSDDGSAVAAIGQGVPNPVYNQVRLQLVQAETEIATLAGRKTRLEREIENAQENAKDAPLVEAEMAKLNRDYNIIREKYDELVGNRENSRLIREINTKADKVKFRIIDPPEVPLTPIAPNRQMLLSMVLGFGVAAGAAIAFVFSQLQSSFATMEQLRTAVSLPVIGTVTTVLSDQQRSQRKLEVWAFAVLFFAVFLTYGAVMAWEYSQKLGTNALA